MIRKPAQGWDRERVPVVAARKAAQAASIGISTGRSLVFWARAAFFGFFALIWGWAGLAAGLIAGDAGTLIGAGGAALFMGWLAKRNIDKARGSCGRPNPLGEQSSSGPNLTRMQKAITR